MGLLDFIFSFNKRRNSRPKYKTEFKYARKWEEMQKDLVDIEEGEFLVLAPPGCGKTDILTERIRKAIHSGTSPQDMICLTFTNRASREMVSRISKIGSDASCIFVGNLHRYCSEFLFSYKLVDAGAAILDEDDIQDILEEFLPDEDLEEMLGVDYVNFDNYTLNWRLLHNEFLLQDKWAKPTNRSLSIKQSRLNFLYNDCRLRIVQFLNFVYQVENGHPEKDWLNSEFLKWGDAKSLLTAFQNPVLTNEYNVKERLIWAASQFKEYKDERHLLTFDDLITYTFSHYLHHDDKGEERLYPRFTWIQVDEVQDLNPLQIDLIDLIKHDNCKCTLYLGDEQQAIFSFIGAKLETLNDIKERCGGKVARLKKNFRSPKYLVDLYNKFAINVLGTDEDLLPIANNDDIPANDDKMIFGFHSNEVVGIVNRALPHYLKRAKEDDIEAERKCLKRGDYPGSLTKAKTAIIVPTNNLADKISEELSDKGIEHFKISGQDIFSTNEIKTLIAHLSVVLNEHNYIAWSRILWQTTNLSFKQARDFMKKANDCGLTPLDFLSQNDTTYIQRFETIIDSQMPIVVFDTETTGLDVFKDDIVQIAAFKVLNGKIIDEKNLILRTEKYIPEMLGEIVNPLVKEYEECDNKKERKEGLLEFMSFIKGCSIVAHNSQYDYNILDFNLKRDCAHESFREEYPECFDTLKLARLILPSQRMYKLKHLGAQLNLTGVNSHLADDDARLTVHLMNKLVELMKEKSLSSKQYSFMNAQANVIDIFKSRYNDLLWHTTTMLYASGLIPAKYKTLLGEEMDYVFNTLYDCKAKEKYDKIQKVIKFVDEDVVNDEWGGTLFQQLSNCITSLSTFKEADLCGSKSMQETLFVSTVHKAKGLEFQNVIVTSVVDGLYPFSMNRNIKEKKLEDARKLYVAISRAKKRLCLTYEQYNEWNYGTTVSPFLDSIKSDFKQFKE